MFSGARLSQVGDDVVGFVQSLAADDQARHLLLASDMDEVVLIAGLQGVARVHGYLVLVHEAQNLLAEGAGLLVVKRMVLQVRHARLLSMLDRRTNELSSIEHLMIWHFGILPLHRKRTVANRLPFDQKDRERTGSHFVCLEGIAKRYCK